MYDRGLNVQMEKSAESLLSVGKVLLQKKALTLVRVGWSFMTRNNLTANTIPYVYFFYSNICPVSIIREPFVGNITLGSFYCAMYKIQCSGRKYNNHKVAASWAITSHSSLPRTKAFIFSLSHIKPSKKFPISCN